MNTKPLPELGTVYKGLPLTPRMKSMGITGMVDENEGWRASFETYPNLSFILPAPVVDWLFAKDQG